MYMYMYIAQWYILYVQGGDEEGGVEGGTEKADKAQKGQKKGKGEKRLKNQFNFSERASQTLNNPARVGDTVITHIHNTHTYTQ